MGHLTKGSICIKKEQKSGSHFGIRCMVYLKQGSQLDQKERVEDSSEET